MNEPLLQVQALGVSVQADPGSRILLHDVSFDANPGEALGIVGESGAGKSTLAMALLGLLPARGSFSPSTRLRLDGRPFDLAETEQCRALRGRQIGTVFQEPLLALDPSYCIGEQLREAVEVHALDRGSAALDRAHQALLRVGFDDAGDALRRFPHELSGGMRQRALIAAAIVLEPRVLIADEPTTALDVTLQAQVLDLLDDLRASLGMSLLLISHDLDVVGERCSRALVLERGRVVEAGSVADLLRSPTSAAASRLAVARRGAAAALRTPEATHHQLLLDAQDIEVRFPAAVGVAHRERRATHAVRGVSIQIRRGEAIGIVGESGCGKSSLARAILRLGTRSAGRVVFDGIDLCGLRDEPLRALRRRIQFLSQDAGASLTPHRSVRELIAEGLVVHNLAAGAALHTRVDALLEQFGLDTRIAAAVPDELSSGQRQRVALARALAVEPELLVCDEPVSSLDASLRAEVLAYLVALRREREMSIVLISHDLAAVRSIADRVYVMYHGRIVESGISSDVTLAPQMPYTRALLSAEPNGEPRQRRTRLSGQAPAAALRVRGCPFAPRCDHPMKDAECELGPPPLIPLASGRRVACWKVAERDAAHIAEGVI